MPYKYENERKRLLIERSIKDWMLLYHELKETFGLKPRFTLEDFSKEIQNRSCDNWQSIAQIDYLCEIGMLREVDTFLRDDAPMQYRAFSFVH